MSWISRGAPSAARGRRRWAPAVLAALLLAACSDGPAGPEEDLFRGSVAASLTDNPAVPAIALHEDGSRMAVLAGEGPAGVGGAVFTAPGGQSVAVHLGATGLPVRAVAGEVVFLFDNYTRTTVDVAAVHANGALHVARGLPFDSAAFAAGAQALAVNAAVSAADARLSDYLRWAGLSLNAAGCVLTAATLPATFGASQVLSAALCGATLASIMAEVRAQDESDLLRSANAVGSLSDAVGCTRRDVAACISLQLDAFSTVAEQVEALLDRMEDEIAVAGGALGTGFGDVQVTLTWNNAADLDLHVVDPRGEEIWFAHPAAASGGRLDRDDTSGFGPENVFWPVGGAPAGTYRVSVVHYSGPAPAGFTVLVQQAGRVRAYQGTTTGAGQRVSVVTFTLGQTLPAMENRVAPAVQGPPKPR